MSRIHDALKKAEQERSIYKAINPETDHPVAIPAAGPIPVAPPADVTPSHAKSSHSATSGADAVEAMIAHHSGTVWNPDTNLMLFFDLPDNASGTEEFRTLRSRLYQLREKQPLRKVLVASSMQGEGKSFVAANLAQAIACQSDCRVLLIDADLRNPSLHINLGTLSGPGLSDYLLDEADESAILQRGQMQNLFFIASGKAVTGQSEMLSRARFRSFLKHLEPLFDWIIIDSPATVRTSDSTLLANCCDGVLMVVRSNTTPVDVVRKALQKFHNHQLLGVVLNGIPEQFQSHVQENSDRNQAQSEMGV